MTVHLMREIHKLKKMILSLSAITEEAVQKAARAIAERDAELARQVIEGDLVIDRTEVEVEEECLKLLALHQPVAIDLRYIVAILKINNDLERIGDLAVNIAEQAVVLAAQPPVHIPFDFMAMASRTQSMLLRSLDALVNLDSELAMRVLAADDEVDDLHRQMYEQVQLAVRQNVDNVSVLTRLLGVSRNLERIADHATNIAEDVIYMTKGEIVRHGTHA
jgi:phosphate transport system protein